MSKILLALMLFSLAACESVLNSGASITTDSVATGSNPTPVIAPFNQQTIEATLADLPIHAFDELPSICKPREIAQLAVIFFDAFNRGDQSKLATLFFESNVPDIRPSEWYATQWIASDAKIHYFTSQDVPSLLNHFAERHQRHERLTLLEISVRPSWVINSADISFLLVRQADDISKSESHGKGNINCEKQRIRAWSTGMEG